jgi:hypothetical protein
MVLFSKLGLLDPDSNDTEQRARIIAMRFKSVLKIFVTLWQIVAIMPFTLDMVFPDIYSAILVVSNSVNIDVCRHSYDAIDRLVVDTSGPLIFAILLWLVHLVHLQLKATRNEISDEIVKANYNKVYLSDIAIHLRQDISVI